MNPREDFRKCNIGATEQIFGKAISISRFYRRKVYRNIFVYSIQFGPRGSGHTAVWILTNPLAPNVVEHSDYVNLSLEFSLFDIAHFSPTLLLL